MMNETVISSLQNPQVKRLVLLQQKSSERRKQGVFVVEGLRELQHCQEAGYQIESVFLCPELAKDTRPSAPHLFTVTPKVYEKIAY